MLTLSVHQSFQGSGAKEPAQTSLDLLWQWTNSTQLIQGSRLKITSLRDHESTKDEPPARGCTHACSHQSGFSLSLLITPTNDHCRH